MFTILKKYKKVRILHELWYGYHAPTEKYRTLRDTANNNEILSPVDITEKIPLDELDPIVHYIGMDSLDLKEAITKDTFYEISDVLRGRIDAHIAKYWKDISISSDQIVEKLLTDKNGYVFLADLLAHLQLSKNVFYKNDVRYTIDTQKLYSMQELDIATQIIEFLRTSKGSNILFCLLRNHAELLSPPNLEEWWENVIIEAKWDKIPSQNTDRALYQLDELSAVADEYRTLCDYVTSYATQIRESMHHIWWIDRLQALQKIPKVVQNILNSQWLDPKYGLHSFDEFLELRWQISWNHRQEIDEKYADKLEKLWYQFPYEE